MNPVANLPPQPVMVPGDPSYAARFNEWVGLANQAMTAYKSEYSAAMAQQGISVQWDTPQAASPGSPFQVPPTYNATLTKDGFSSTTTVSIGRAQTTDPDTLASFDQMFNLKFQAQVTSPNGSLPSQWYAPTYTPPSWVYYPEPTSAPGPQTTVNVPLTTLQPQQTPTSPDLGTIVAPPTTQAQNDPIKHTFWEWNFYYEQETGRTGPPPEAVGVSDGNLMMTKADWWGRVSAWYASPANGRPIQVGTGGGAGGAGGTGGTAGTGTDGTGTDGTGTNGAAVKDYTQLYVLAGAMLLIILLAKR